MRRFDHPTEITARYDWANGPVIFPGRNTGSGRFELQSLTTRIEGRTVLDVVGGCNTLTGYFEDQGGKVQMVDHFGSGTFREGLVGLESVAAHETPR